MSAQVFILGQARKFKRAMSDEPLRRHSISLIESLHPFLLLSLLNHKIECKRDFDTVFIIFNELASNHAQEEVDLSFAKSKYPTTVKVNQTW